MGVGWSFEGKEQGITGAVKWHGGFGGAVPSAMALSSERRESRGRAERGKWETERGKGARAVPIRGGEGWERGHAVVLDLTRRAARIAKIARGAEG